MNDRIMKLAYMAAGNMLNELQFGISYDAEGDWRLNSKEVEKFAELIVRECAERSAELGQPEIGLGILKHFGVEES